jgi:hypothetical protein
MSIVPQSVLVVCILLTFIQKQLCDNICYNHVSKDNPRWRYKVVPQVQHCFQLLLEFTRSWNVFEQYYPRCDLNVLVHWLSFFYHIVIRSPILHLIIFLYPPADLTIACFSFSGSTVLPPSGSTFQGVLRRVDVISVNDFVDSIDVLLCLTIFLLESTLTFQRSCLFKSSLLKWNQRCLCLKKIFLKNQAFWSKTQHTFFKIYSPLTVMYFENRNWHIVRLKMDFSWFFVSILDFDLGVSFDGLWLGDLLYIFKKKTKCSSQNLRLYQKRSFPFLALILSVCIITSSLIYEATTLMEKLFQFWERHLSVQIAYLIKKGF